MPKNLAVTDTISKNLGIVDVVPKNLSVKDVLPKNVAINPESTTRSYNVTIGAGQYIGLPFLLTYPSQINTIQWSESGGVF